MIRNIKSRILSLFDYIYPEWLFALGHFERSYVLPQIPDPEPFSDAELKECTDVLSPLGYIAIRNLKDNAILVYRQRDLDEQRKAMELILQQLSQDVL